MGTSTYEAIFPKVRVNNNLFQTQGAFSFIGLLSLLTVIVITRKDEAMAVYANLFAFLTGDLAGVSVGNRGGAGELLFTVTAIVLLGVFLAIICMMLNELIVGRAKSYRNYDMDSGLDRGPLYFFLFMFLEELLFRQVFLGWISPRFDNPSAFYVLLLTSNVLFAAIHLINYDEESDRSALRVVSQFITGLLLSYLFVRYGLFVSVFAHTFFNLVLLSTRKEQWSPKLHLKVGGYYAAIGILMLFLMTRNGHAITDVMPWFAEASFQPLSGYSFWDYVIMFIAVNCILDVIADILALDYPPTVRGASNILAAIFSAFVYVGMIYGTVWLTAKFSSDIIFQTIVAGTFLSLLSSAKSGSSFVRGTLITFPAVFIAIALVSVLGFWSSVGLLFIYTVSAGAIPLWLRYRAQEVGDI